MQLYRNDLDVLAQDLVDSGIADVKGKVPIAVGLYTGPVGNAKPVDRLAAEVQQVKAAGYDGVAFFCWETTLSFLKANGAKTVLQTFQWLLT